jgi:outer membrane protein assembly factor BamB
VRSSIVTGLTLQIAAILAVVGLASAQVPPPGSAARGVPTDTGQQPSTPGQRPGPATPAEAARQKAEKEKQKDKDKDKMGPLRATSIQPLQHSFIVSLGAPPVTEPAYDDQHYMVAIKSKQIGAWSIVNGQLMWVLNEITPLQPLTSDAGRLYVILDGEVAAFETTAGKPVWRVPSGGTVSAPAISKAGWLIYALDTGELRALRGETGELVWQAKLDGPITLVPVIVGDRLYVATGPKQLAALDVVSGQRLWTQTFEDPIASIGASEKRLFVSTDKMFLALDHGGDLKWKRRVGVAAIGQPVAEDDTVYITFNDNTLVAFGSDKGDLRFRTPLPYRPVGGPAKAYDCILLTGLAPVLHTYFIKDGKLALDYPLPLDTRTIMVAQPRLVRAPSFFQDRVLALSSQAMEGIQRQGPGTLAPFIDPGAPCPALSLPGEAPPPATASVPAPPKP